MDLSSPMIVCSTADQHMSRLLFRGYGVADNSLPIHAALAGTKATITIDEAHIIPTYEQNLRCCVELAADIHMVSMTATPSSSDGSTLQLGDADMKHVTLSQRLTKPKSVELVKGKPAKLVQLANNMIKHGARAVVVFCNTANTATDTARAIPGSWLLTGRVREYDRNRMNDILSPLRSGADGPEEPTVVVATQTLEVGADLDFDGLVTEAASLSSLRQRFGRLDRLGKKPTSPAAILWDGKKTTPVYGESAGRTFDWLRDAMGDTPDMSTASISDALTKSPPTESLDPDSELGPAVSGDLIETWQQTNPRPLWDVPVGDYIDPSDDTTVSLVWRDEAVDSELVEGFPPHRREAAPVPINAVRHWADDREGIRWRGAGTAEACKANDLRPGDVWVLQSGVNDGRAELGCTLTDSPADVADIPGQRIRADAAIVEAINDGISIDELSLLTGIDNAVAAPRGEGYVVHARRDTGSLSAGDPMDLGSHCHAVGNLAREMAELLGLDGNLLRTAGVLHDIGKADARMQAWMGGDDGRLLAKSGQSPASLRYMRPVDLPRGWRHELLSARMLPESADPSLVDLVGAHHGRCRPAPPPHAENGSAAIEFAGGHYEADPGDIVILESEALERFASLGNPWTVALRQSILVMADRIASRDELTAPVEPCPFPTSVTANHSSDSFVAPALDGTTLLGWLAAVGALRMLTTDRKTRLHWNANNEAVFHGWELGDAVEYLARQTKIAPSVFRPKTMAEFESQGEWGPAAWRYDGKTFKQSPLIATGGGQTGLERAWPKLAAVMTPDKICEAFVEWVYYPKLGQRWDNSEHADHGSQWDDPSKSGSRSVHGANRLAIEALPILPSLGNRITIGFDHQQQAATWPIWRQPLSVSGVRVAVRQPMRERWMSRKIDVGQLASFLSSEPVRERSDEARNTATARS